MDLRKRRRITYPGPILEGFWTSAIAKEIALM